MTRLEERSTFWCAGLKLARLRMRIARRTWCGPCLGLGSVQPGRHFGLLQLQGPSLSTQARDAAGRHLLPPDLCHHHSATTPQRPSAKLTSPAAPIRRFSLSTSTLFSFPSLLFYNLSHLLFPLFPSSPTSPPPPPPSPPRPDHPAVVAVLAQTADQTDYRGISPTGLPLRPLCLYSGLFGAPGP